jgi:perosamine synthetase
MHVPQFRSFVDRSDYEAIAPVFENNYIAEGPFSRQFHDELLNIIGSPHGVFASNGTLALYLALRGLGIGPGDEVLVQDVTFIASANSVEMTGATPVFVDIVSATDLSIDLDRIVLNENTKAIMVAHLFGTACSNIEEVAAFCKENGLFLVEDAAQALAITDGTTHCGTFGDVGTFSFYADKTITTAEGGFVVTPHADLDEKMRYLRNQGRLSSGTFMHPEIGYNFRITDMQAALGLSQLSKLDHIIERKTWLADRYRHHLGDAVEFLTIRDDFSYIPFRVVAFVDDASAVMEQMVADEVEPRSMFVPMHKQPCYEHLGYRPEDFPMAEAAFKRGMCLPTWVGMTEEMIEHTSQSLLRALSN